MTLSGMSVTLGGSGAGAVWLHVSVVGDGTSQHFYGELDINDFPGEARYRATHRDQILRVQEDTGCAVISRGQYIQPGKTPEATMASALYTDIKRWKAGIPGCVFCRPQEGLFG